MLFTHKKTRGYRVIFSILLQATILSMFANCKFAPLYGESSAGDARFLKLVKINRIDSREGQKLRTILKQKFGQRWPPENPRWLLTISLTQTRKQLGVKPDSTATRRELGVTAKFTLRELGKKSGRLLKGQSLSISSFNELASEYANLVGENNARDRSLGIIANDLRNRIMLAIRHPKIFGQSAKN